MEDTTNTRNEQAKRHWTDKYVEVNPDRQELSRFKGIIGRVVTVNWNNKALIDFQDGGWYDITADEAFLTVCSDQVAAKAKYDPKMNSAQLIPEKQG